MKRARAIWTSAAVCLLAITAGNEGATQQEPPHAWKPYRRVITNIRYRAVWGDITVPTIDNIYGVGGHPAYKECAYNYFAIRTATDFDMEVGMKSATCDGERWWGFIRDPIRVYVHLKYDNGVRWPGGTGSDPDDGLEPGTPAHMRIYVSQADCLFVEFTVGTDMYTKEWSCPGATPGGANQHFRRVTSLCIAPNTDAMSHNNNWAYLRVEDQTDDYVWDATRTSEQTIYPGRCLLRTQGSHPSPAKEASGTHAIGPARVLARVPS